MKKLIILSLILSSCASWHQKKIEKHTNKLLSKGVVIPKDTIEVIVSDTIIKSFTRNDTTFIEKLVTNTITLEPIVEFKTRWQIRTETKYKTRYIKEKTKQKKQEVKIVKAENRRSWWILFVGILIGVVATIFTDKLIRKIDLLGLTK